jgi:DegV family protein with EDD domain
MRLGALELKEKFPDRKIFVIDSLSASLGQGLLVYKALVNQQNGMSLEENAKWVEDNKQKIIHLFTVDDLGTLKRGGRLTATKAFLGTLLMLKPVLHVDPMGRLVPLVTKRGRKQAFAEIIRLMEEKMRDDEVIFISHGDTLNDALELKGRILELHPNNKVFLINHVGPVIGSHSGPGTIALFFIGKDR